MRMDPPSKMPRQVWFVCPDCSQRWELEARGIPNILESELPSEEDLLAYEGFGKP